MNWKDISSHSRNEKRIPNAWEAYAGMLRVRVHRHIYHPGAWCISCAPFWDSRPLNAATEAAAKAEAESMLTRALRDALKDLE